MILNDEEIKERIESPLNLLNRLRSSINRHVNNPIHGPTPCLPPKSSDIIDDLEDKIANTTMRSKAMNILNAAMDELQVRIPEVQKPEKLAAIAAEMSKVILNQNNKNQGEKTGQIIVYAPQIQSISNYEVIDVAE